MNWNQVEDQILELSDRGLEAFKYGQLDAAEMLLDEAAEIARNSALQQPTVASLSTYATLLMNIAMVLDKMGANPEVISKLEYAETFLTRVIETGAVEHEHTHATLLMRLAAAYEGPSEYLIPGRVDPPSAIEMQSFRRESLRSARLGGRLPMTLGEGQQLKKLAILDHAVVLMKKLYRSQRVPYESQLPYALMLLGKTYLDLGNSYDAESPLLEAFGMYNKLARESPQLYNQHLQASMSLLSRTHSDSAN